MKRSSVECLGVLIPAERFSAERPTTKKQGLHIYPYIYRYIYICIFHDHWNLFHFMCSYWDFSVGGIPKWSRFFHVDSCGIFFLLHFKIVHINVMWFPIQKWLDRYRLPILWSFVYVQCVHIDHSFVFNIGHTKPFFYLIFYICIPL